MRRWGPSREREVRHHPRPGFFLTTNYCLVRLYAWGEPSSWTRWVHFLTTYPSAFMNVFILNTWCFYDQKSYRYFTPLKIKRKKEWYSTLDTLRPANKSYCLGFRLNLCNTMWDSYFILTPSWGSFHLEGSLKRLSHEKLDTKKRNTTWRLGGHQSAGFACLAGWLWHRGIMRESRIEKMELKKWQALIILPGGLWAKAVSSHFRTDPSSVSSTPVPLPFPNLPPPASLSESLTSYKSPSSLPSPVFFN